jgi:putative DNA primase/helicase
MSGKFDADAIKASVNIASVIGSYVDLKQDGKEFKGLCPFHSDKKPSFHVVPEKGFYHCFGCGEHGDVIDFLVSHAGVDFRGACEALGGETLPDSRPIKKLPAKERHDPYKGYEAKPTKEVLVPGKKIDLVNPKREGKVWKDAVPVSVHRYSNQGYVIRLEIDGTKLTPQVRYTDQGWTFMPFDEPRPIYGLESIHKHPDRKCVIVEGEKSRDALFRYIGDRVNVVSWCGGTNGVSKTDWTPLAGKKIVVIPDRDNPGLKAMKEVVALAKPLTVKYIAPPEALPKGWDVADEDWADDREIYAWCKSNTVEELPESYGETKPAKVEKMPEPVPPSDLVESPDVEVLPRLELVGKHSIDSMTIARALHNQYLYDGYLKTWFKYNTIWREVPREIVTNGVRDEMDIAVPEGYQSHRLKNTLDMLQGRMAIVPQEHEGYKLDNWSTEKHILPMRNGVLDLKTRNLSPHRPEYHMNWMLPHEWHGAYTAYPTISKFLQSISNGDKSTVETLMCYLAAVLKGMSYLQKFLEIIGTPGTGKSTLVKLGCELVGTPNLTTTSLDMLQNNQFETANLYGKRLAIITDADKYGGGVEIFKAATGQDPLRYEKKNQQQGQSFIYQGMIIVAANQPVQYKDQSTAMMRRRIPVHIDHRLREEDRDPDLSMKLIRELPGLLHDLVMLEEEYIVGVLTDASGVRESSKHRSLVETNPHANWMNEKLVVCDGCESRIGNCVRDGSKILNTEEWLYPNFVAFQEHANLKTHALNSFRRTVEEIGHTVGIDCSSGRNSHGAFIKGLRLREDTDSDDTLITNERTR